MVNHKDPYDYQYMDILKKLLYGGDIKKDHSRDSETRCSFGEQIKVNIADSFPILHIRKIPFSSIADEIVWMLKGLTNIRDLNTTIWNKDAYKYYRKSVPSPHLSYDAFLKAAERGKACMDLSRRMFNIGDCGKIYGYQWRSFNGIVDQIGDAVRTLSKDFHNRQVVISSWNPSDKDEVALPPCHFSFTLNGIETEKGRELRISYHMRSNDFYLGQPFNTAGYALLLSILADMLNAKPTYVVAQLDDVHLYDNQIDASKELIKRWYETRLPWKSGKYPVLNKNEKYYLLLESYHNNSRSFTAVYDFLSELDYKMFSLEDYYPEPPLSVPMLSKL